MRTIHNRKEKTEIMDSKEIKEQTNWKLTRVQETGWLLLFILVSYFFFDRKLLVSYQRKSPSGQDAHKYVRN